MTLLLIPAGEFLMGSPEDEEGRDSDESPQHLVRITRPFYLGMFEVTQEQYERVMGDNPSETEGPRYPVENVSWRDAVEFCERLSALPEEQAAGRGYRLPSEAEWEYACRAGTSTAYAFGMILSSDRDANCDGHVEAVRSRWKNAPVAVGSYRANAWGLHDMHGNVWEWCADRYGKDYYASSPEEDPPGPEQGSDRVARGGSYGYSPWACRSASRVGLSEDRRERYLGFRVVMVRSAGPGIPAK